MSSIITVWGSPASGKTVTSLALAAAFAAHNRNVIVFSSDKLVPALKLYCPNREITGGHSIGPLLMSGRYDDVTFAERLIPHSESEYICFAGMAPSDTYITYQNFERTSVVQMLNKMSNLADYVIIDGASNPIEDTMTLIGLELSDCVVRVTTADVRGLLYLKSARHIYQEEKYHFDSHITVLGNIHDVSPVSEVISASGKYDYTLCYAPEVENRFIAGELMKGFRTSAGRSFEKNIRRLAGEIETK